jgi:LysM repeat protein
MKKPKFLSQLSAVLSPRPKKRLQATARAARPAMDDYDDEEPTTKLSSAFVVVLILHVVAVGGIYAFNSIKASRKEREATVAVADPGTPASGKTAAQDGAPASIQPATHAVDPAPVVPAPTNPLAAGHHYQVKTGDNLTRIAFAYGVTPAAILEANHLKEGATLKVGEMLTIPTAKAAPKTADTHKPDASPKQSDVAPTSTTPGFYTVKKGDTPTSIAHKFGVTIQDLLKANKITDPKKLQLGQTLKVPPHNT